MTDAFLAELRQLLANAQTAGAIRPRLVLYQQGAEVMGYLQADAASPGETWTTATLPLPTAAAWPQLLDEIGHEDQLRMLLEDPHTHAPEPEET